MQDKTNMEHKINKTQQIIQYHAIMKNMMNIFASKITDSFFFDLEVKPQIREQMRLGTYL